MKREPRHFYDPSGEHLVAVPLQIADREVILPAATYLALREEGVGRRFHLNDNGRGAAYVRASLGGRKIMVARFVAQARRGQIVRYRDGDHLNLRPGNLLLESGRGRTDCRFYENF